MKIYKGISWLLTVLGILAVLASVMVVYNALDAAPMIMGPPDAALGRVEQLMDAVCEGDYKGASKVLYGTPNLGTYPDNASMATILIWDAFLDSLEYEVVSECYATESGAAVDVQISYLDVPAAIAGVDAHAQTLLNQRIAQAKDMDDIYDEENNYRQDMLDRILQDSIQLSLEENKTYKSQTLTLELVHEQDQWWVMPESELLDILAGAFAG